MTNDQYVDLCYENILQRQPNKEEKAHHVKALEKGAFDRLALLLMFLDCEEYKAARSNSEFVTPGHFYSAITAKKTDYNI